MNKHYLSKYLVWLSIVFSLSGCEAIGAIFKAGVWSGILLVVLVVALIIFIVSRLGNRK
jgi:TRAP-type C4-dicarboxylate transport system permease large subunit